MSNTAFEDIKGAKSIIHICKKCIRHWSTQYGARKYSNFNLYVCMYVHQAALIMHEEIWP